MTMQHFAIESETGPDSQTWHFDGLSFIAEAGKRVFFAYQPIVSIRSGQTFGFEALLRGHERIGLPTIGAVFDHADSWGTLHRLEVMLRQKAIAGIAPLLKSSGARLFFNMDNRVLQSPDYVPNRTAEILEAHGLDPSALCFEISEQYAVPNAIRASEILKSYRSKAHLLALDDFGTGFSGLQLLYDQQPNIVKIDRFFISGICRDERKKLFVSSIVNLAHILGITVVAEGIETESEFRACREIGCDLAQGWFIARPTAELPALQEVYPLVAEANRRDRRALPQEKRLIREELIRIPALSISDPMAKVFEIFRNNVNCNFFPVLDQRQYPIGFVRENDLKYYIYSPFGKDLLRNKSAGRSLYDFIISATVCDINADAEQIIAMYSHAQTPSAIIVTENFRYAGVLSAESLLRIINEKNLAHARDQNPLTRLPGNNRINDYLAEALEDQNSDYVMVYFDLDNFKPFNDCFGFRQGDRAILMFSEVLRSCLGLSSIFLGHIGGDDFFAGFRATPLRAVESMVRMVLNHFSRNMESFYEPGIRERGFYQGKDRAGNPAQFPLLSCSAALLHLPQGPRAATVDQVIARISEMKKQAKRADDHIAHQVMAALPASLLH
jgi:EAL domain-containing protein (putative c-di-GMP-specific phosphodiesterase class I)/GGDEF domain-containing protein